MALGFVVPMSLLPPLMYAFSQTAFPGGITPMAEPPFSAADRSRFLQALDQAVVKARKAAS